MADADALFSELFDSGTSQFSDNLFGEGAAKKQAERASGATQLSPEVFEREWYVVVDGVQVGPISMDELSERWQRQELEYDTLTWKTGMSEWQALREVSELNHLLNYQPSTTASAPVMASMTAPSSSLSTTVDPVIDWKPSAAHALAALVDVEMGEIQAVAQSPAQVQQAQSAAPGFGGVNLFDNGPGFGPDAVNAGAGPGRTTAPHPMRRASDSVPLSPAMNFNGNFTGGFGGGFAATPAVSHQPFSSLPAMSPGLNTAWRPATGPVTARLTAPHGIYHGISMTHVLAAFLGFLAVGLLIIMGVVLVQRPSLLGINPAPAAIAPPPPPVATPALAVAPPIEEPKVVAAPAPKPVAKPVAKPVKTVTKAVAPRRPRAPAKPKEDDIFADRSVKAKLSRTDIMGGVRNGKRHISHCSERARRSGELPRGNYRIVLDWQIRPDGSVTKTRTRGSSTVENTSIPACIALGMRKWSFPSSKSGAPIRNFGYKFRIH